MITIQNLEIQFDVEGDDDEQTFARLFNEFIRKWAAQAEQQRKIDAEASRERSLTIPGDDNQIGGAI